MGFDELPSLGLSDLRASYPLAVNPSSLGLIGRGDPTPLRTLKSGIPGLLCSFARRECARGGLMVVVVVAVVAGVIAVMAAAVTELWLRLWPTFGEWRGLTSLGVRKQ